MNRYSFETTYSDKFGSPVLDDADDRLAEVERRARYELEVSGYPLNPWVAETRGGEENRIYDVVIQGAGMQAVAIANLLQRHLVTNILLIDENDVGLEGPWLRYARMHYLRTPKHFVGPDLGFPPLSFRTWFVARHGEAAWREAENIPKVDWVAYLRWFRQFLRIPVLNSTTVRLIEPTNLGGADLFRVTLSGPLSTAPVFARKVIRAAGALGAGGPRIPEGLARQIDRGRYNHSSDAIDFRALSGRRVAVVGAGASAYDNAATALEHGARSVEMFMRRPHPSIKLESLLSTLEWMKHYADMEDAERWRMHEHLLKFSAPPPHYAVRRVRDFGNFALRADQAIKSIVPSEDGALRVETEAVSTEADHIIFATGFDVDLGKVSELSSLYASIALWRDRCDHAAAAPSTLQGKYPYLGANFEYQEKSAGEMPCLRNLYEFGPAGTLSLGMTCVGLNSLNFGVRRLVDGVTRSLFLDDLPRRMQKLLDIDPADHPGHDEFSSLAKL